MTTSISIPAAALGVQGITNTVFGIYGLIQPEVIASGLEDAFGGSIPHPVAYTSSLQLLNMGILTFFAATLPGLHRRTLIARTCLHLIAGYLFWQAGEKARNLAVADLGFAVLNAVALPFVKAGNAA